MRILLPRRLSHIDPAYGPLFFLAGPIKGGGDWQQDCCREIQRHIPHFYAALPNHYKSEHSLMEFRLEGEDDYFPRSLNWERYHLDMAGQSGCVIFWLPRESLADPRTGEGSYAMDTRGEIGEWRGRLMHNPELRVVIGAELGFPGLDAIQRNFEQALGKEFVIHATLEATVKAALEKVL